MNGDDVGVLGSNSTRKAFSASTETTGSRSGTPAITAVVALEVDRTTLVERMRKRAETEARTDDDPDVVVRRLEIYDMETAPVIEHYRSTTGVIAVTAPSSRRGSVR